MAQSLERRSRIHKERSADPGFKSPQGLFIMLERKIYPELVQQYFPREIIGRRPGFLERLLGTADAKLNEILVYEIVKDLSRYNDPVQFVNRLIKSYGLPRKDALKFANKNMTYAYRDASPIVRERMVSLAEFQLRRAMQSLDDDVKEKKS